jgi:phosphoglycerate kinase
LLKNQKWDSFMKLSLQDLDLKGKKVLMRVDFNVPLKDDGTISDDTRIRMALPSIEYVLSQGAALILMSHLGRPKGSPNPAFSLKPCAERLSQLIGKEVKLINPYEKAKDINLGEAVLLENLRFHEGEEHPEKDPSFAKSLAELGDIYVNDAFGTAHRKHASTAVITQYFPKKSAMGFLMEKEVSFLSQIVISPKHPFYAILGGAKLSSKIGVLESLLQKIDAIFVGGGMAFTFLKLQGIEIGDSLCDDAMIEKAKAFLKGCEEKAIQVHLPKDIVITNDQENQVVLAKDGIPSSWKGMDIGPKTLEEWATSLDKAATIFWNGPMGVFEVPAYASGTNHLAQNLSTLSASVIVGGGDSVAAINGLHLEKSFAHISTGGGAALEYIEYGHLPGIDALTNK